jgi:cyclophilin family peptidyl-prolyl cis-trans isomerase
MVSAARRARAHVFVSLLIMSSIISSGCNSSGDQPAAVEGGVGVIETDMGTIKFELLVSESPQTVQNFRLLAERGYYDGTVFHRTISGFMIQGGDPTGSGAGGETATGKPLPNEINPSLPIYQGPYRRGVVAMANKGRPESASSQFFIMHQDYRLPPNYTIFGRVIEGQDVVDKIATAPAGPPPQGRPVSPAAMRKVYVQ